MGKKALVIGATSYVGSHLVPALLTDGFSINATGRNMKLLAKQSWTKSGNVTLFEVNLADEPDLQPALEGVDTVYFLVHGMAKGKGFYNYEMDVAHHVASQLSKSNVKRVVYLGATMSPDATSEHLMARKATGNILRQSGKQIIELRAAIIIGPGSAAFEIMRDVVSHLPVIITPKSIQSTSIPIALKNVLHYLTEFASVPVDGSPVYDLPGPEYLSYESQMRRCAKLLNRKLFIVKTPLLPTAVGAYMLQILTSVPHSIARAMLEGLAYDLSGVDRRVEKVVPQKLVGFDEAVQDALEHEDEVVKNDLWGYDPEAFSRWHKNYSYYAKHAGFTIHTEASAERIWKELQGVGGDHGYYFGDWIWQTRAIMDAMIGGSALNKIRPESEELKIGDRIDSWKVIQCEKNTFLSLLFGMKAPGLGRLEFTILDKGDHRELDIRAWWHPDGFWGLLYWFAMMPAHLFIFRGMARALVKRCSAPTSDTQSASWN